MDKADEVKTTKRGRPKKEDAPSPIGQHQIEQAEYARRRKAENTVVEKYYTYDSKKLLLCKRVASGTVYKEFIGVTKVSDKASDKEKAQAKHVNEMLERLKKEGRVKYV